MSGQDILQADINKGWRPFSQAIKDEENLRKNASTGQSWNWIDKKNNIITFN